MLNYKSYSYKLMLLQIIMVLLLLRPFFVLKHSLSNPHLVKSKFELNKHDLRIMINIFLIYSYFF